MMKLYVNRHKPFRVEELRQSLAQKADSSGLLETYSEKFPEVKDLNKKHFWNKRIVVDRAALKYNHIYQDKLDIVSRHLRSEKGKLLDVGFGWGILERKIEDYLNINVFGIDISTVAVNYAKANLRGEFKTASIFDIPFRKNKFDIVIVLDILEHIRPSRVFSAYSEIDRVLKKGGSFIVSIPINEGLEEMVERGSNPVGHLRAYTPDIIKAELKLSGFDVVKTEFRYAFKKFYRLKNLIMKFDIFKIKQPNLMIIVSRKTQ